MARTNKDKSRSAPLKRSSLCGRFKGVVGPGGIKCACCADSKTNRGRRKNRKLGRMIRRKEKHELRNNP